MAASQIVEVLSASTTCARCSFLAESRRRLLRQFTPFEKYAPLHGNDGKLKTLLLIGFNCIDIISTLLIAQKLINVSTP